MRIVWTWPCRRGQGPTPEQLAKLDFSPDYNMLHWCSPHVNRVQFAELDSYGIRGLSAVISRNVPNNRIHYILGATGVGRRRLRRLPCEWLSCIEYVFIHSDEPVRARLLSNPVLNDPLDLMIYCYRRRAQHTAGNPIVKVTRISP